VRRDTPRGVSLSLLAALIDGELSSRLDTLALLASYQLEAYRRIRKGVSRIEEILASDSQPDSEALAAHLTRIVAALGTLARTAHGRLP